MNVLLRLLLVMSALTHCAWSYGSTVVNRMEPPFWWAGMKSPHLQLMLHGQGLAELRAVVSHPEVKLLRTHKGDSPNYLFLDLALSPKVRAGDIQIALFRGSEEVVRVPYELRKRDAGSSARQGFGTQDAIYLLVPDRFANGDSTNDSVDKMAEKANRADSNGRHGGDLAGIEKHLDYIAEMGFTQIWSTPLLENNQPQYSYHGYAITDLYKVDPRFGSNDDYKQFVSRARAKGLGVIQDIVLNHIGAEHRWMRDLPTKDWVTNGGTFMPTNHAHITALDPYAASVDVQGFANGWFDTHMPDLNQKQPLLATYLIQNTIWWIEYAGLSGVREDTYSYADKAFLSRWSKEVMAEYPNLTLVGEEMSYGSPMVSYWQRGARNLDGYVSSMPSMMDFPVYSALRTALTKPDDGQQGLYELYQALGHDFMYAEPSKLVLFEGNHDMPRLMTALDGNVELAKMAIAFVATAPRIPQFFYGTEIGMADPTPKDDGKLRADFPGGWDGDTVNAFTGVGLASGAGDLQAWMRKLLNWRKTSTLVHTGKTLQYIPEDGTYVFFRYRADSPSRVMVVINKNRSAKALDLRRFNQVLSLPTRVREVTSGMSKELRDVLEVPASTVWVLETVVKE